VEASLKEYLVRRRAQTPRQAATTSVVHPVVSSPLEENCLALMLKHPELKGSGEEFPPEYFENSENREIFITWQQVDDLTKLKEKLDESIHEYFDSLINRNLPTNKVEERYADYNRRSICLRSRIRRHWC
jgi:hypothetical protein